MEERVNMMVTIRADDNWYLDWRVRASVAVSVRVAK